jgi:predicted nucleotidyltransferase
MNIKGYFDECDVWHEILKGPESTYALTRFKTPEDYFSIWKEVLEERVRQAVEKLSSIPCIRGLILGGGIGKGDPWPLSDIDVLGIYTNDQVEATKESVKRICAHLEKSWMNEGFLATVDIGKIVFSEREVEQSLKVNPSEAVIFLHDMRWYHGLDKFANGQTVYDPDGLTKVFLDWITAARHSPEVMAYRQARVERPHSDDLNKVEEVVGKSDIFEANLAVRNLVYGYAGFLYTGLWGDSGKLGRNCTRFERIAELKGVGDLCRKMMRLIEDPARSAERLASAPYRVHDRHRLSWPARQLTNEKVTKEEDARDVLDLFTNIEISYTSPPFDLWTGLNLDRESLKERLWQFKKMIQHPIFQM